MNFKIDFVFPYVDCSDPEWKKLYKDTMKKNNLSTSINENRFREFGFIKYYFRGLAKFLPWLNNIYIIVQSKSQLPKWLNTDNPKIKVVYHEDIIPKVFLPVYNSTTIEMFIKNIKGLSEHFIYANDDMYCIKDTTPDMFFSEEGIPKTKLVKSHKLDNQYRHVCYRQFELVTNTFNNRDTKDKEYYKPCHIYQSMLLSTLKEAFDRYTVEILNSITTFRRECNFNQYLYTYYQKYGHEFIMEYPKAKYYELKEEKLDKAYTTISKQKGYIVCLNDSNNSNLEKAIEKLIPAFDKILGEICEYEKPVEV